MKKGCHDWSGLNSFKGRAGHWIIENLFSSWAHPYNYSSHAISGRLMILLTINTSNEFLWVVNQSNNHSFRTPMVNRLTMRITLLPSMICHCIVVNFSPRGDKERQCNIDWDVIYRCVGFSHVVFCWT